MLMPKKVKYRKVQRGRRKGLSKGARKIEFGEYGLQAITPVWFSARQIEAMRVTIARGLNKDGKLFLRVFPDKPITKKPAETRMGKGKGNPEEWVSVVKRGRIICEIEGLSEEDSKKLFKQVRCILPMKTRFVKRGTEEWQS
jgi:large subunit ribosomal protein L16